LGYVYINGTHSVSKPTTAKLTIDKNDISIGEEFTLSCDSDVPCLFYCSILFTKNPRTPF
jgi:hypothetical protein